jgi:putative membrane protein
LILALLLAAGTGLGACSDRAPAEREGLALADDQTFLTDEEREFIEYAAEMHTGEIAMAQQAKEKSSNDGVKKHADAVIKTHSEALKELGSRTRAWADLSKHASADTEGHMKYLSPFSGERFDKEFVDLMVADHKSAVETFNREYGISHNANLKKYMKTTIQDLEHRLSEARSLQN